jgi:hypothetical protein
MNEKHEGVDKEEVAMRDDLAKLWAHSEASAGEQARRAMQLAVNRPEPVWLRAGVTVALLATTVVYLSWAVQASAAMLP